MARKLFLAVRAAALTLVALWLLYVVAVNVVLRFDVLEDWIQSKQSEVTITFDGAWSWWPGRVEVENLRILGHGDSAEFLVDVDHADVDVDLDRLVRPEFSVETATVTGVTFRLRFTEPLSDLCRRPKLPPIPSLADPSRKDCAAQEDTAKAPEPDMDPGGTVRVHLRRMGVHDIREIWIDEAKLAGDADAYGEWYFWPGVLLAFDRARIDVHTSTVTWRAVTARDFALEGGVTTSATISVDHDSFAEVLHKLRIRARGRGDVDAALAVDGWSAQASSAETNVAVDLRDDAEVDVAIDTDIRRGDFEVMKAKMAADVFARAALVGRWPSLSLAGSKLLVRHAQLEGDDDPWEATVDAERSTNAPDGAWLSGVLRFTAHDARLVKRFAAGTPLPKWVLEPLAETEPSGDAELARRDRTWLVPRARVKTGIVETKVRAAYGDRLEAMALFTSGALNAAYHVDGEKTDVILLDALDKFQSFEPSAPSGSP